MKKPPTLGRKIARGFTRFGGERAAQLLPEARLAGPMPWVIAIMVTLVVVATAGGLAMRNIAETARAELAGGATVQVLEALPQERERQAQVVEAMLGSDPMVASIRRVPDEELDALLEPWLGADSESQAVPVPALIDVRLRGEVTQAALDDLQARIATRAPDARIDAQASWLAPVFGALTSMQYLALGLVMLLSLTSAAAVWLAARSALGTNRGTIEVVHMLGGTDSQIARIFERSIGFDATMGGAVGLTLGLGAILLLGRQFAALGSGMVAGGALGWLDWVIIAAVPLAAVALAMLTARLTVLSALRRML
ncbi:cell division protein FtsX [Parerythrobacter lacustris]|uniref:Cell division protein n=1 Tax=Parerythrobacter lacustris TaxID=2969984 RepID=A0ABT1XU41_9SPHN|nr:cell division protein [Parerythrobacter lacustris]MCR2835198.1 cell division protein [Parerythrobacter lacustris]